MLAALGLGGLLAVGMSWEAAATAAISIWCATWWILESVPLPASSLLPFALLPLAGVLSHKEVATAYGHTLILLMVGGSMVSMALEASGAHRRIALAIVRAAGRFGPKGLILGFMTASAVLSMWMSNTATTMMLLPVVLALAASVVHEEDPNTNSEALTIPLLLAVCYGASIGGSGTPIGTPPNLIVLDQLESQGQALTFSQWMGLGLPVVAIMLPVAWLWLSRSLPRGLRVELPPAGPWRSEEKRVLLVFTLMALAWMTRAEPFGGWGQVLGVEATVGDATVALLAALALFVLPARGFSAQGPRLLNWEQASRVPWGVFIMISGGMALGKGFVASGLDRELGEALVGLTEWPRFLSIASLSTLATFATEVTSNTATANVLMPVLAATAKVAQVDPLALMLPAALGLNHAFMLPVATAPNAIIYGTGQVPMSAMIREGIGLNLAGVVVITAVCLLLL